MTKNKFKKIALTVALSGALVLSASPFATPYAEAVGTPIGYTSNGNPDASKDQKIIKRVDAERAVEHIRYLSEEIGPRPGGLEGEKQAADYVASQLRSHGYEVEYQYFLVADQYIAEVAFANGDAWQMGAALTVL